MRVKNGLRQIAEHAGVLGREAAFDHGAIDGAENTVDVARGGEVASGVEKVAGESGVVLRSGNIWRGGQRVGQSRV